MLVAEDRSSINMIGSSIRPPNPHNRPRYTSTPRATTPQPRVHRIQQPVLQPKEEIIDDYELIPNYDFSHNNNENAKVSDLTSLLRSL
eukprot:1358086-Amphidinium_carterae.1